MWTIQLYNCQGDYLGALAGDPLEVGEYEAYPLTLHLDSDLDARDFAISVEGRKLPRRGSVFTFGSGKGEHGRFGEVAFEISFRGQPQGTGFIAITTGHFSPEQYRFLIQDLKRLFSLASQDQTAVRSQEESWHYLCVDFYDRRLQTIGAYIERLKTDLATIEHTPQRAVAKHYVLELEERARRVDARTIRWLATHAGRVDGKTLTYTHVEHHNLYENRFLAHILDWLLRLLDDLPSRFAHALNRQIETVAYHITQFRLAPDITGEEGAQERQKFRQAQIDQLDQLHLNLLQILNEHLPQYGAQSRDYYREVQQLRGRPMLEGITSDPSFKVSPTLVLLRDPAYNTAYSHYLQIRRDVHAEEQQRFEAMLDHVPIERTSKLYEYWVFLQIYLELRSLGFADESGTQGIVGLIDQRSRLRSGAQLRLKGDPAVYTYAEGLVEVELAYEPRLGGTTGGLCPDVMITFTRGDERAVLILDMKYRDYDAPGCSAYSDDVEGVAHQKYLLLQRQRERDGPWIPLEGVDELRQVIRAAFIIHSHDDEQRFRDYGSAGHSNQYGAIPLVPSRQSFHLVNLRRLLTMFMRMHFGMHDICWSDSGVHQRPVVARQVKQLGGRYREDWEWEYQCDVCDNHWWVNHCGVCGKRDQINYPKITFAHHSDDFFLPDNNRQHSKLLLKCSRCNQSYWSNSK